MSQLGQKRTSHPASPMSAFGHIPAVPGGLAEWQLLTNFVEQLVVQKRLGIEPAGPLWCVP
jgi:hypothetical protein